MANIMQKLYKIILVIFVIQIIFTIGSTYKVIANPVAYPTDLEPPGGAGQKDQSGTSWWDAILSAGDDFLGMGKNAASSGQVTTEGNVTIYTPNDSDLQAIINDIYSILFPLGVGITVIIGGVLGIKFMMASAEDKAKVKESMIPYVIGCIVIYGAFGIWKLAITIFSALG